MKVTKLRPCPDEFVLNDKKKRKTYNFFFSSFFFPSHAFIKKVRLLGKADDCIKPHDITTGANMGRINQTRWNWILPPFSPLLLSNRDTVQKLCA